MKLLTAATYRRLYGGGQVYAPHHTNICKISFFSFKQITYLEALFPVVLIFPNLSMSKVEKKTVERSFKTVKRMD